jgi:hypothetical protein
MLGMMGIIVKNSKIQNTIQILQEIKPGEKFLCRFLNSPVFSRVCEVEEIQNWLLFQDQDEANAWVASSAGPRPEEASAPALPPAAAGGNGALNENDAADPSEPEKLEERTDEKPAPIIPAAPVPTPTTAPVARTSQAEIEKSLEPEQAGGKLPENHGKKS